MKKILTTIITIISFLFLVGCDIEQPIPEPEPEDITKNIFNFKTMDTIISGHFFAEYQEKNIIINEMKRIFKEVEELTDNFKSHGVTNDVYNINLLIKDITEPLTIEIDELLYDMLDEAIYLYEITDGYFDFSIGYIIDVWKDLIKDYESSSRKIPQTKIDETDLLVQDIEIIKDPITLLIEDNKYYVTIKPGVKIDLGAHAKGYATKLAQQYLRSLDITDFIINGGSSSISLGIKDGASDGNYLIGLKHPLVIADYYALMKLQETNATTSGSYEQYVIGEDGNWYHHIISPKTKRPINNYYSLSIIGDDAGLSDGFSTALFSMSIAEIESFIELTNNEYEVVIFDKDEEIININKSDRFIKK